MREAGPLNLAELGKNKNILQNKGKNSAFEEGKKKSCPSQRAIYCPGHTRTASSTREMTAMLPDGNFDLPGSSYLLEFTQDKAMSHLEQLFGVKSQIPPGALKCDVPPSAIAIPRGFVERWSIPQKFEVAWHLGGTNQAVTCQWLGHTRTHHHLLIFTLFFS